MYFFLNQKQSSVVSPAPVTQIPMAVHRSRSGLSPVTSGCQILRHGGLIPKSPISANYARYSSARFWFLSTYQCAQIFRLRMYVSSTCVLFGFIDTFRYYMIFVRCISRGILCKLPRHCMDYRSKKFNLIIIFFVAQKYTNDIFDLIDLRWFSRNRIPKPSE